MIPARLRAPSRSFAASTALAIGAAALAGDPVIGPPIAVDTLDGTFSANEVSVAVSPVNPLDIVVGWHAYIDVFGPVRSAFSLSRDGGLTWESALLRPPPEHQATVEGDPMTAADPRTGTMWAGAIAFGNWGLYIARKDPGKATFEPPVMVDLDEYIDKGWMAAGPRRNQPDTTRVFCAYNRGLVWSDDMGDTWTTPTPLAPGRAFLPRIGPGGEIYVMLTHIVDGVVRLRRSLDDGATFTTHDVAVRMDTWSSPDTSRFPGLFRAPAIAYFDVDQSTGTLHACYFDTASVMLGRRNVDIFYTRSFDQGTTWDTPRVIHGDGDPPGDQFFPWLEVDGRGRVHLVYLDSRHTDQDDDVENGMFDAYYAVSEDDGDTFREFRLTSQPWSSADDGIGEEVQFIGDYLGLATVDDRAYPVYIDTSIGRTAVYTRIVDFGGETCVGDLDGSGAVDFGDILAILAAWGAAGGPEDLDGSGTVDFGDLLVVLGSWGDCS